MKALFSIFLLGLINTLSFAQNNSVDSLLRLLNTEIADTARLKVYTRIGDYYIYNNTGKAIEYYKDGLKLSEKLNDNLAVANNQQTIGYCYSLKGDFGKSLDYYFQSVRVFEKIKNRRGLAYALMSIANVYFQNNNLKKTDEYHDKSQRIIENLNDNNSLLFDLFASKAQMYDKRGLYDTSLQYSQKAYQLAIALKDDYLAASILSDIGLTYKHQKKTPEALRNFEGALAFFKKTGSNLNSEASIYNNIGATHAQAGNYTLAKDAFNKSISIANEVENPNISMENYRNLSDLYGGMKRFELQAQYLQKYYTLKDSLFSADSKNQLTQLEADYNIEQKNIEILKQEGEIQNQKNQRNIFIIIALAAALLLTTLGIFYSRIKKANQLLETKNIQISKQKDEIQMVLHDLKSTQAQLIKSEKLASIGQLTKGIVDRILNPLNYINNFSESSKILVDELTEMVTTNKGVLPEATVDDFQDVLDLIKNSVSKIYDHGNSTSRIVKDMQKLLKEKSTEFFETELNEFVESRAKTAFQGIKANYKDFRGELVFELEKQPIKTKILPPEFGDLITFLIDNAMYTLTEKNKIDKKFIPQIKVSTELSNDAITLKVTDNGKGISPRDLERIFSPFFTTKPTSVGTGLGLFMSKDTIELHNGTIQIQSKENEFTELTITLPSVNKASS